MKKRYLIIGTFAFSSWWAGVQSARAQTDSVKVSETTISIVYNQYIQDGNNSAVTGGIGTEKLTVYGPSVSIQNTHNRYAIDIKAGTDVISSASTDNIDYIKSSASLVDARTYGNLSFTGKYWHNLEITGGIGSSIESDYFSLSQLLSLLKTSENEMRQWSVKFQFFNDDLRWGRLDKGTYKPQKLIYPSELRNNEWYNTYKRYTFQANTGMTQLVNRRNSIGLFFSGTVQDGLLATPFHRVYFSNDSLVVENLPSSRMKGGIALQWNNFSGGRFIHRNIMNISSDNWGIRSFSLETQNDLKISFHWLISTLLRYYSQSKSSYFAPYKEHIAGEKYYSSDYDFSTFNSFTASVGARYTNLDKLRLSMKSIGVQYFFYHRTNGLNAHSFSLVVNFSQKKNH